METCKHVWLYAGRMILSDRSPNEGRVVAYCPLCKSEIATEWVKFRTKRTCEPYDTQVTDTSFVKLG